MLARADRVQMMGAMIARNPLSRSREKVPLAFGEGRTRAFFVIPELKQLLVQRLI
jgi:hypothetical protein